MKTYSVTSYKKTLAAALVFGLSMIETQGASAVGQEYAHYNNGVNLYVIKTQFPANSWQTN